MPEYINPNGDPVRIASTSGHVVFIGAEPINILPHMESEARAMGCLPLSSYRALEEKIRMQLKGVGDPADDNEHKEETIPPLAAIDPATITAEQKLKKVVEVLELMLDSDAGDSYFTVNGLPRATEVSNLAGFEVDKELRETAWEQVKNTEKK